MKRVKKIFQAEPVFCVSLLLAALSALVVRPDGGYLAYPDYRTIALLFCLMIMWRGFSPWACSPGWGSFC